LIRRRHLPPLRPDRAGGGQRQSTPIARTPAFTAMAMSNEVSPIIAGVAGGRASIGEAGVDHARVRFRRVAVGGVQRHEVSGQAVRFEAVHQAAVALAGRYAQQPAAPARSSISAAIPSYNGSATCPAARRTRKASR